MLANPDAYEMEEISSIGINQRETPKLLWNKHLVLERLKEQRAMPCE
jgi:hypothetical protein